MTTDGVTAAEWDALVQAAADQLPPLGDHQRAELGPLVASDDQDRDRAA